MLDLDALLSALPRRRAAAVGDLMLDRFVYGSVDRISPEAPIPVMRVRRQAEMLGGVGNTARNLAALGVEVTLAALVGSDAAADRLHALIRQAEGLTGELVADPTRPTSLKTRFVAAGQQLLRLDDETLEAPSSGALGDLKAAAIRATSGADVVLVSDYAKGVVTEAVLDACYAGAGGAPILVDPKSQNFARYGKARLIKPNAKELALAAGRPTGSDAEVEAALLDALQRCTADAILVTRAEAGMSLLERGGEVRHFRGEARQVFDVSGAGDTALAALAAALAAQAPIEAAVEFSLLASGVVVGKAGTAVVSPAELRQALREAKAHGPGSKIFELEAAAEEVRAWKDQTLRVGFTNGCFDLIHRGHVTYLAEAKRRCDRLIVGLNSDASIRSLKGPERPLNDLESRALVLAALSSVDLIVAFEELDPLRLIERLRPDILMKGADYRLEEVVGGDLVRSWGGTVELVPLVEGYSTTKTLERMRKPE